MVTPGFPRLLNRLHDLLHRSWCQHLGQAPILRLLRDDPSYHECLGLLHQELRFAGRHASLPGHGFCTVGNTGHVYCIRHVLCPPARHTHQCMGLHASFRRPTRSNDRRRNHPEHQLRRHIRHLRANLHTNRPRHLLLRRRNNILRPSTKRQTPHKRRKHMSFFNDEDEPKEVYRQQLRLFRGRMSNESFWKNAWKPVPLIAYPAVLFSTVVYGS
jgi:hypothetical protein